MKASLPYPYHLSLVGMVQGASATVYRCLAMWRETQSSWLRLVPWLCFFKNKTKQKPETNKTQHLLLTAKISSSIFQTQYLKALQISSVAWKKKSYILNLKYSTGSYCSVSVFWSRTDYMRNCLQFLFFWNSGSSLCFKRYCQSSTKPSISDHFHSNFIWWV